jgi:GNAT superfamily N-acetyltransferase
VKATAVTVRPFAPRDQDAARWLIIEGLGAHFGAIDETLNRDLDDIADYYARHRVFVADDGGEVVGTGILWHIDASCAEIRRMSVAKDLRRSGVGRAIMRQLLSEARLGGYERVMLRTLRSWDDAVGFYRTCGFAERSAGEGVIEFEMRLDPDERSRLI